jgi:hypothetical protein
VSSKKAKNREVEEQYEEAIFHAKVVLELIQYVLPPVFWISKALKFGLGLR